jgi:hypothetical protein
MRAANWALPIVIVSTTSSAHAFVTTSSVTTASSASDLAEIERALARDLTEQQQQPAPAVPQAAQGAGALQKLIPDISLIGDFALAAFSEDENLQGGGHDPTVNGFNLQQLEMSIQSNVDPYFRFDANIVFAQFGVEVEEAYGTTLGLPFGLQARGGQFLTRFGRINPTHPHSWDFVDQPFAVSRVFGGEGNRGLGLELSWLTPLPWYVELVGSSNMAGGEATARSFFGQDDLGVDGPLDLEYVGAIKQFFPLSDDLSLLLGLSGATGPNATGRSNRSNVFGIDLYLKFRPITEESITVISLQSEWLYRRRQIPEDVLSDLTGYAQVFWRFAARWGVAIRYELGTPALDQDGEAGSDALDPDWTKDRHRTSASLTFWPTEFSRLRIQGSADLPSWRDEPIFALFLAAELAIGAHGAHSF